MALAEPERALADLAGRHGVRRARLFDSVVARDFDPARSDVDVLVWGLAAGAAIELAAEIAERVRRDVHVVRAEAAPATLVHRVEEEGREARVA